MVKAVITGKHPETNEEAVQSLEAEAICAVSVKQKDELVIEVGQVIMGSLNGKLLESVIGALIATCKELLKDVDPALGAYIMMRALNKDDEEEKSDGMAGESSEPERPSEQ